MVLRKKRPRRYLAGTFIVLGVVFTILFYTSLEDVVSSSSGDSKLGFNFFLPITWFTLLIIYVVFIFSGFRKFLRAFGNPHDMYSFNQAAQTGYR